MEHERLAQQHAQQAGSSLQKFHESINDAIAESDEADGDVLAAVGLAVDAIVETGLAIAQRIAALADAAVEE